MNTPRLRRFAFGALKVIAIIAAAVAVFIFLVWLFFGRQKAASNKEEIDWGVTYSAPAAEQLQLDPDKTYRAIVNDLQPERLRLVAYWNRIEQQDGEFDYSQLDRQVKLAEQHNIPFVIVIGQRVPRYPECHIPNWARQLDAMAREEQLLDFMRRTIQRYDNKQNLFAWQVENEPFLGSFGVCPEFREEFLKMEIELARELTDKTIMTTESGELSFWLVASKYPDVLGSTLYRAVLISDTDVVVRHVFPPAYYRARANIIKLFRDNIDDVVISELQAEPWAGEPIVEADRKDLKRTMNPEQFERNVTFTEEVGFSQAYFWGVEWWYYEKLRGNDYYWQRGQELFK